MLSNQTPPLEPENREPDVVIDYTFNRKTGQAHLTVHYRSAPDLSGKIHNRRHQEAVESLLEESGLLGTGKCLVRMQHGAELEVREVVCQQGEYAWRTVDTVTLPAAGAAKPSPASEVVNEEKVKLKQSTKSD